MALGDNPHRKCTCFGKFVSLESQCYYHGFLSTTIEGIASRLEMLEEKVVEMENTIADMQAQYNHMEWQIKCQFDHSAKFEADMVKMFKANKWVPEETSNFGRRPPYHIYLYKRDGNVAAQLNNEEPSSWN